MAYHNSKRQEATTPSSYPDSDSEVVILDKQPRYTIVLTTESGRQYTVQGLQSYDETRRNLDSLKRAVGTKTYLDIVDVSNGKQRIYTIKCSTIVELNTIESE